MVDPGFLPGTIGVVLQMLFNMIIDLIKNGANCLKEFDELRDRLHTIYFIYGGIQIYAERIGSLPSPVYMWLTKLNDFLQQGSHFLKECTIPSRWDIISSFRLTKKITRFTLVLDKHLTSTSLFVLLLQFQQAVANREAHEQIIQANRESHEQIIQANRESFEQITQAIDSLKRRISPSAGAPGDVSPSTSSAASTTTNNEEAQDSSRLRLSFDALADIPDIGITLQLCFLSLPFSEAQVITTANATKHWIRKELLTGRDCHQIGQGYVNLLADCSLIEPLSKNDNRDVRRFRMPHDFHDLAHQIAEEEKRIFRTGGDSQEFSANERLHADAEVHIKRGTNLAVRDWWRKSSDPYVVVGLGDQKRITGVRRKNLNPVWNEKFSLPLPQSQPLVLKLEVLDKDRLSRDDPMGYGEVDLNNLARAARMRRTSTSPYSEMMNTEGIKCVDGYMVQEVCLKLQNVESGELYLDIKWVYRTN